MRPAKHHLLGWAGLASYILAASAAPLFHDEVAHCHNRGEQAIAGHAHSHKPIIGAGDTRVREHAAGSSRQHTRPHDTCPICRFLAQPNCSVLFIPALPAGDLVSSVVAWRPLTEPVCIALVPHCRAPPQVS